jgi:hypothetical protein
MTDYRATLGQDVHIERVSAGFAAHESAAALDTSVPAGGDAAARGRARVHERPHGLPAALDSDDYARGLCEPDHADARPSPAPD